MKDDKLLDELSKLPEINIWENYKKPEPDPDAWKYRVNGYEDYLTPRTILNPRYLYQYEPEKEKEFTVENTALESLMQKDPTELIRPEKERIIVLLRARGYSLNEICAKVELSKPTVIKAIRKFATEISKLNRTELEEVFQFYHFTYRKRIETLGKIQGILMAELETRSVKDIPTDKLIELILKCDKAVSDYLLEKIIKDTDPESKLSKTNLY